ncbi:MAG: P-loop NTPase [Clostridia bacterium]|nr:P-loop NTPase [Clostridia bacterium]
MAEIYAVASGKGGVGKSTVTAGLSKELSALGKRVLAVDCDIGLRSLDLLLHCDGQVVFDWGDCVCGRCAAQRAVISGDVDFIAAPRSFEPAFTPDSLGAVLDEISAGYDYIFLDAPAGIGTGFRIAAGCADKMLAVTTADNICVRSCAAACSEAERLGIKDCRLIINMFEIRPAVKKKLLNLDECIDETQTQLIGVVPFDRVLAFASVTGLEPDEFGPSVQAFHRIAERITGKKVEIICE